MSLPVVSSANRPKPGLRQSAFLMRALGAKAASVWSQLSSQEAERLSQAMKALPEDHAAEQDALRTYVQSMHRPAAATPSPTGSIWHELSGYDGEAIASLLQTESPQVIALTLSRLRPDTAATAVRALPRSTATEALRRLLNLSGVHPAAANALGQALKQGLAQTKTTDLSGGHEHVARIFDQLGHGSESTLLSSLDQAEPGSGEKIRALMFTFEDLVQLDPASLQTILNDIDRSILTVALKGASAPIANAFFSNMTQRAVALLQDEIAHLGAVRRSEIEAARAEILKIARTLVKRGELLPQSDDDELIE
ncbi:MAG: FliG C-terminal domain-containing protein [Pseudomonadota bacterium]